MSHYQTTLPERPVCESDKSLRNNIGQLQTAPNMPTIIQGQIWFDFNVLKVSMMAVLEDTNKGNEWRSYQQNHKSSQIVLCKKARNVNLFRALLVVFWCLVVILEWFQCILSACMIYTLIERVQQGTQNSFQRPLNGPKHH